MTILGDLPTATADIPAVTYNGKIYVFGGYGANADTPLNKIQIYDPSNDSWSYGIDLTYARWGATAQLLNDKIYIFGGTSNNSSGWVVQCEVYDPVLNTISVIADLNTNLRGQGLMGAVVGTKIYIFKGVYVYEFDSTANGGQGSFTQKTNSPISITWGNCNVVTIGEETRIYILGGYTSSANNEVMYYIPSSDTWVNLTHVDNGYELVPYQMYGGTTGVLYNNYILYGFGQRLAGEFFSKLHLFDPITRHWSGVNLTGLTARDGCGSAVIGDTLYIIGGRNVDPNPYGLVTMESYDLTNLELFPIPCNSIFSDDFSAESLDVNKWDDNYVGTITGSNLNNKYRITGAGYSWISSGAHTGQQHRALTTLPTNCDIKFDVLMLDDANNQMGQAGLSIVQNDNTTMLFVGQMDDSGSSWAPKNCLVSESATTNRLAGWTATGSTMYKALTGTPTLTSFEIRKRNNVYSVYVDGVKVCDTTLTSTLGGLSLVGNRYSSSYPFFHFADVFNINVVNTDTQCLIPVFIESAEVIGALTVSVEEIGTLTIITTGIGSSESLGDNQLNLKLFINDIISEELFGDLTLKQITLLLSNSINSEELVNNPQLNFKLFANNLVSEELFGNILVTTLNRLVVESISSNEFVNNPQLNFKLFMDSINSDEVLGNSQINLKLLINSISSNEFVNIPQLNLKILMQTINSLEEFGLINIIWEQFILVSAIGSGEVFGLQWVYYQYYMQFITIAFKSPMVDFNLSSKPDTIITVLSPITSVSFKQ